ncbi:MAG: InlB B-repeat-containing protein, partial [Synergistaceae bacterium]|nr:InlB B-repeat-containing protein [Synergistaceae bacterium]
VTVTDGITDYSVTFTEAADSATFTMPDNDVTVNAILRVHSLLGYSDTYKPDGTAEKPYIISSSEGWEMFCNALNNSAWNNFEGKTVKLDADISTGNMAERFKGTFDGDSHILTFTYASTQTNPAPFRNVEGTVTIKNLHVAGTITNSGFYAAGLIANQSGTTTIENCRVSITIEENGNASLGKMSEHGGFVAKANGEVNITGCVFDGKMLGSSAWGCGGFVGKNNDTVNISASLFAPSEITMDTAKTSNGPYSGQACATFSRGNDPTITNGYYTETFGTEQGAQGYTVSASDGITVTLAESSANGMMYDGVIYAGAGETVTLEVTANEKGYSVASCTASAGTLTKTSEGVYTLEMPSENAGNVTITATTSVVEYTISYELNGGEIPNGLSNPSSYGINSGITILANPERAGYEFTGWTGTELEEATMTVMIPIGATGDRNYVAHWTAVKYTITYDLNGGNVAGNPESYTIESDAITLNNPTLAGYKFAGWTGTEISGASLNVTIPAGSTGNRSYVATWKSLAPFGWSESYNADGSEARPYKISGVEGWNLLADELNDGESYGGKKFSLEGNLEVTTMLGMNGTGFAGVFEGNGKTLTVNYDSELEYSAPFVYVNGGTIKDLTVTGTIKTSGQHIGGIIGQSSGNTAIEACNFVGKLLTTNTDITIGGGFVAENNGTLTISNSLYAPATLETDETEPSAEGSATFVRNTDSHTSEIMNSYYTRKLGTEQGKQGYTVTAETGITVALAEGSTNGLSFDGTIYAGSNETVSLTISGG